MINRIPVSFHAVYSNSILDALKYANLHGFDGIQVAVETPHLDFNHLSDSEISQIQAYLTQKDLYITLHGPDDQTSLFSSHPALLSGVFEYYRSLFEFAKRIKSPLISIHLGQMTTYPTDSTPKQLYPPQDIAIYQGNLKKNLQQLISIARDYCPLCIENYYFNLPILEVLSTFLDREEIYLCWDIPKTYSRMGVLDPILYDFFKQYQKSIKQIHLHDLDRNGHGHQEIGTGIITFETYFTLLENCKIFDYCIEVRPESSALNSLKYLKTHGFA